MDLYKRKNGLAPSVFVTGFRVAQYLTGNILVVRPRRVTHRALADRLDLLGKLCVFVNFNRKLYCDSQAKKKKITRCVSLLVQRTDDGAPAENKNCFVVRMPSYVSFPISASAAGGWGSGKGSVYSDFDGHAICIPGRSPGCLTNLYPGGVPGVHAPPFAVVVRRLRFRPGGRRYTFIARAAE